MPPLSIIIPVYNERHTLAQVLAAVGRALPGVNKNIVVIDDCSTDGTREWLQSNFPVGPRTGSEISIDGAGRLDVSASYTAARTSIKPLYHDRNRGKGAALRTGFAAARGDVVVIQDADLEYDPQDWAAMYDLIAVRKVADVVYGSRFHGRAHRSLYFHHYLANRLISLLFNMLYNQTLSDIETCYKMMTARGGALAALVGRRFRGRGRDQRQHRAPAQAAHLRARHHLLRPQLRRGQEDQLEGRREGALVPAEVQIRLRAARPTARPERCPPLP